MRIMAALSLVLALVSGAVQAQTSSVGIPTGMARVTLDNVGSTQWAVVVDLSDTTNFPHKYTGRIDISQIGMQVDRESSAVGRFQMGVVTRVDATSGDVTFFRSIMFEKGNETNFVRLETLAPLEIQTGVVGGKTQEIVSSGFVVNDTGLQTDVPLKSPLGDATVAPGVGDIVVRAVYTSGGTYNATGSVLYSSEKNP